MTTKADWQFRADRLDAHAANLEREAARFRAIALHARVRADDEDNGGNADPGGRESAQKE
jgi:hypothetical protein